jgi:hypothetical protein
MDYKQSAKKLAQQGRYGDTMLMHVSPKEVAGLNYLGKKYGTQVTRNPKTGLPEAFNFGRLIPMIAGAALAPYTGGVSAGLIVGGVETARTGSLLKGAQAGFGAFGGANLATSLGTAGAEQAIAEQTAANLGAAGADAAVAAAPTGADILAAQQPNSLEAFLSQQAGGAQFVDPNVTGVALTPEQIAGNQAYIDAGSRYAQAATQAQASAPPGYGTADFRPTYGDIGRGFERLGTAEGVKSFGADLMSDPMQTAKTVGGIYSSMVEEPEPYKKEPIDYSKYPQAEPYRRNYRENPNPREDREFKYYDPNALYVNKGGITSIASAASPSPGTYKELIKSIPQASNNQQLGQLLSAFLKNQNAQSSKNGGQQRFNIGGLAGGYTDYMRQLQQMVNKKGMANPDMPSQAGTPMQAANTGNAPQEMDKMRTYKAGGSVPMLEDGGFVLRASTVNGVGNGSSEAGMKYLQAKLGAVPIRGKGDGTKDQIATSIEGRRKALLSNEEAYIPRSVVAQLGNGDINKGAKKLDEFMKKVDKARTGKAKPPKTINPDKLTPKKTTYA